MKKILINKYSFRLKTLVFILTMISTFAFSQNDSIQYRVDYAGVVASGDFAPFWFQSKQFGKISQHPFSTNLGASIHKSLNNKKALFEYGFNADFLVRTNNIEKTEVYFQQLYLQARFWIFDMTVGAKEVFHGCHDPRLSAGGYLFSENSRPMPRITAGIEEFRAIPLTWNLLEIKGAISHGWFADEVFAPGIFLHHKYMFLRLGGKFPVRLQVGLDHAAQWGGEIPGNGEQKLNFQNLKTIFFGKSGGDDSHMSEQINALGNHIVSEHIKLELELNNYDVNFYWQTLAEDGPIRILPWLAVNRKDGLWGLNVRNNQLPFINGFVYEFFSTLDQSGPWHDKDGIVYGGRDSYFTNGIYQNDWAHFGRTIGTPLILSPVFNRDGSYRIIYNDLQAHHFGIDGHFSGFNYRMLATFSRYYINNLNPAHPNTSWLIEISKKFTNLSNTEFLVSVGGDTGEIPGKTSGLMFSVRKNGILFRK